MGVYCLLNNLNNTLFMYLQYISEDMKYEKLVIKKINLNFESLNSW